MVRGALAAICGLLSAPGAGADAAAPPTAVTIVHAGTLLAVPGEPPRRMQTLVIRRGRVAAIREGYLDAATAAPGEAAQIVDLTGAFVLPGLIDLHVHLTTDTTPGDASRTLTRTAADLALVAAGNAGRTLRAGFTTVLDLGTGYLAHEEAIYALREAIADGRTPGPRILAAGSPISPTGSSRTHRYIQAVTAAVPAQGVCDGAAGCAAAVREQIRRGADVINFYNSGSLNDLLMVEQTFTDEEMRAIVGTAHALGRKVVADGHTARGINAALRAGADIIDTAPWPDEDSWKLLAAHGASLEPHLYAFRVAFAATSGVSDDRALSPGDLRVRDVMSRPFAAATAVQRKIPLVYGSDSGIVDHGDNAGDLSELVKIGLSPMAAIEVATVNSARALGLQNEIGSLAPGMRADLIATAADPLADIAAMRHIVYVMRDGQACMAE